MKTVLVKDLVIGSDMPKICVPIVGVKKKEILEEVKKLNKIEHDLMELRIDYFEYSSEINSITELLKEIREIYSKPIIFTFRTKEEGGLKNIDEESYFEINNCIAKSNLVDLVDIELFRSNEKIKKSIETANKNNVKVILSSHDFYKTPTKEEMLSRLLKMQLLGADITKIAVMSNSEADVLNLLSVSLEMKKQKGDRPFIAMSMGSLGTITRVSGELFGSCITFASLSEISAPGQLSVDSTRDMMGLLHGK